MSRTVLYNRSQSWNARHDKNIFFHCADCLNIKPISAIGGTGYGYYPQSEDLICYSCCARRTRDDMRRNGKAKLYLSRDEKGFHKITNWTGDLSFSCTVLRFNHPFAREAYMAYFTGPDGKPWSGKNIGDNQIAHCRRLKSF